ncbi:MAG: hypothetical protein JXR95_16185 [Deltaproteobacteria bacterium]|nr:hypothetical protein [Deltaproteobacteria bacterium]
MNKRFFYLIAPLILSLSFPEKSFSANRKQKINSYVKLAKAFYTKKNYTQAAVYFEKAISLKSNSKFYFNIAQCYRLAGELEKALSYYNLFLPYVRSLKNISSGKKRAIEKEITGYIVVITEKIQKKNELIKLEKEKQLQKEKAENLKKQKAAQQKLMEEQKEKDILAKKLAEEKAASMKLKAKKSVTSKWWFKGGFAVAGTALLFSGISGILALKYKSDYENTGLDGNRENALLFRTTTDVFLGTALITGIIVGIKTYLYNDDEKSKENARYVISPYCSHSYCGAFLGINF